VTAHNRDLERPLSAKQTIAAVKMSAKTGVVIVLVWTASVRHRMCQSEVG